MDIKLDLLLQQIYSFHEKNASATQSNKPQNCRVFYFSKGFVEGISNRTELDLPVSPGKSTIKALTK